MIIGKDILKQIIPKAKPSSIDKYADLINQALQGFSKQDAAAFMAQIAHESGSLNYVKEIASGAAYEGRRDLGNTEPGDGVKFKGRGLIQITGRNNYKALSLYLFGGLKLLLFPELLEQPEYAVKSAVWYWKTRNLSYVMNQPEDWKKEYKGKFYNKFEWCTIKINGGLNGIKDRKEFFERAINVL